MTTTARIARAADSAEDPETRSILRVTRLGRADYAETLELQKRLVGERADGRIPDTLVLVEHEPVITVGRSGRPEHILASREALAQAGVPVFHIERGGDVTYHGPGQLVGYPIMRLRDGLRGAVPLLRDLEEALILALRLLGVRGFRRPGMTGIWTDQGKVAAIGVAIRRNVTFHGFALNVNTDLSHFEFIVPCGLSCERVTSISEILGSRMPLARAAEAATAGMLAVFGGREDSNPADFKMPVEWT
jgi:lipoate-protein ligase B